MESSNISKDSLSVKPRFEILTNPDRITHNKPSNILKHCQFRYSPTYCSLQINSVSLLKNHAKEKTIEWATNMAIERKVKNQKESERERSKEIRKKGLCACAKNKLLHYIQLARKCTLFAKINFSHSQAYWLWPKTSPKIIEEL